MKGKNARLNAAVMGSNLLFKLISQLRHIGDGRISGGGDRNSCPTPSSRISPNTSSSGNAGGGESGGGDIVSTSLTSTGEGGLGCGWYSIRTQPSGNKSPPSTSSAPN